MSSSMTMTMSNISSTATTSMSMATTSTAASGGHDMGGMEGMGGSCKISMLWNWTTIDACFLTSSWHITSKGMFAVSCIGVAFLVILLEFLRRLSKEYDTLMVKQFQRNAAAHSSLLKSAGSSLNCSPTQQFLKFRPTPLQQFIRSVLHMATFGVAYIIMLLAMYFNGYIIICIFLGAFMGKFLCDWTTYQIPIAQNLAEGTAPTVEQEVTMCCG